MKYKLEVNKKVWITDTYEIDIPDSIMAEMMVDGEVDRELVEQYIYNEFEPISSEVYDQETCYWELEEVIEEQNSGGIEWT